MSELAKRVAFAIVAVPVLLGIVWVGGAALTILLAIAAALAASEFATLATATGSAPFRPALVGGAAVIPLAVHAAGLGLWVPPLPVVALLVPALLVTALWTRGVTGRPLESVATTLLGLWYTGGMLSFAYALRHHRFAIGAAAGTALVMFPMLVTWVTDAAAFVVGRAVGGPKLMPSVSPGKTISGAIGGLLGGAITAWAYAAYVLPPATRMGMTLWAAIASGVLLSVVAQIGDLVESLLKRQAGVKDSSHLIPGHGGVLDRTDSLLFTLPVGFVLLDRLLSLGA